MTPNTRIVGTRRPLMQPVSARMLAAVLFGVRTARSRLPTWAGRTAVAVGALIAAFAAFLIHSIWIEAPLFAQAPDVPSVSASTPPPQLAAAVDRARPMVRAAIVEQNLPGVSIAVGIGGGPGNIVWAEGFGWRDVVTHTPVTPDTRFNIGTAARAVIPAAVASLGLTNTGADSAAEWSPDHVGEPEEDFPGFTAVHDLILRPIGISAPDRHCRAIARRSTCRQHSGGASPRIPAVDDD